MDRSRVTLHQHLGNAGAGTKVAVDLEGGMGVKEIGIDTAAFHNHPRLFNQIQHNAQHLERMIAIVEDLQTISQLEKAKALLPDSDSIRSLLIDLYVAQNSVDNAIALLNEQCVQTPNDPNAWLRLGVQCIKFRQLDTAEAGLRKVIELEPRNAEAFALLAQVQLPAGRNPQGAIHSARTAVQLSPTGGNHFILGTALYHTGDLAGSKQEILKAVELEPRNPEFRAALEQL